MLTNRNRTLLHLAALAGGKPSSTRLQLLSFLLSEAETNPEADWTYHFLPTNHGPFSFTLDHDLSHSADQGLLELKEDGIVALTGKGKSAADELDAAPRKAAEAAFERGRTIDEKAFEKQVRAGDGRWFLDQRPGEGNSEGNEERCIWTAGYASLSLEDFLAKLIDHGIRRVIDVRATPTARRFGFHKSTLARICPEVGLEYIHRGDVGIPSSFRTEVKSHDDFQELFNWYEAKVLPVKSAEIAELTELVKAKPTALICLEANPEECHRGRLSQWMAKASGLAIVNL